MILVTGGAGFIGSHVTLRLQELGYSTVVLDDLSHGDRRAVLGGTFIQGSCGDQKLLDQIFKQYAIQTVFHLAAFIDVGESVVLPEKYFKNNVENTEVLLDRVAKYHIPHFIFSSTAAVYGNPLKTKISETHPTHPINPYGESKLLAEQLIAKYSGLGSIVLRYFNAAGGDPQGRLKNTKLKESNLIPAALQALLKGSKLTVFGDDYPTKDGTCIRDYIHVWDLAEAHVLALKALEKGNPSATYNLGNGEGYSVMEVIHALEQVTSQKLNYVIGERRPGDPAVLLADCIKAKTELQWEPKYPQLSAIIGDAWRLLK